VTSHTAKLCVIFSLLVAVSFADEVDDVVLRNESSLGEVRDYYFRLDSFATEDDYGLGELIHEATEEVWQSGINRRRVLRLLNTLGPEGRVVHGEHGAVTEYSIVDSELRKMSLWDHEYPPFTVPLEFGRSERELDIPCHIDVADPTDIDRATAIDRSKVYWDMFPGTTLKDINEVSTLSAVESGDSGIVRLRIDSTNAPDLLNESSLGVGTVFDIDRNHGYMVSRLEYVRGGAKVVVEGRDFKRTEGGFWYASRWEGTVNGNLASRTIVQELRVNVGYSASDLEVPFPEGAKVTTVQGDIYLWGKNSPAMVFKSIKDYRQEIYARARNYQRGLASENLQPTDSGSGVSWLVWLNLSFFALLIGLGVLRRKIASRNE